MRAASSLVLVLCAGCANPDIHPLPTTPPSDRPEPTRTSSADRAWAEETRSPWPAAKDATRREAALGEACGAPDGALQRVARAIVARRARGLGVPPPDAVDALLRASGEPHVRPRVFAATGHAPLDDATLRARLAALRAGEGTRCGVALAQTAHGGELAVAVAVDALADLAPVPIRARTGAWLTFDARVLAPARSAKVVVLGPRGAPHGVPTSFDAATGHARARVSLDQPGAFTLQLVGDLDEGPRPLLEARVFADVEPKDPFAAPPAPGEERGTGDDAPSLARMVAAVRESDGAPALTRDPRLDALARAHAERMRDRGETAHDVGDGDPRSRFEAAGLFARAVGENVAHAASVALAHRAIYASPSHRMNLLRADYTHVGVGVVRADDGSVFACEVFAARLAPAEGERAAP